jgi:hypothetical protein
MIQTGDEEQKRDNGVEKYGANDFGDLNSAHLEAPR